MKKNLLILSGLATVVLLVLNGIGTFRLCGGVEYGRCMDVAYMTIINFTPVIPLFLFSLITYWMRDGVYRAWARFSVIWIPLSMIAIFFSPEYSRDWMFPVVKSNVAFFSSLIFTLISLGIVGGGVFSSRKGCADKS